MNPLFTGLQGHYVELEQRTISLDQLMAADRLHLARRVAQRDVVHRASVATPPMGPYAATLRVGRGQMVQTYRPLL